MRKLLIEYVDRTCPGPLPGTTDTLSPLRPLRLCVRPSSFLAPILPNTTQYFTVTCPPTKCSCFAPGSCWSVKLYCSFVCTRSVHR
jgi:hypothetical protein